MHKIVSQLRKVGYVEAFKTGIDCIGLNQTSPEKTEPVIVPVETSHKDMITVRDAIPPHVYNRQVFNDSLTAPGLPNYLPPIVTPRFLDELSQPIGYSVDQNSSLTARMLRASAFGFIADIWMQLLSKKADKDERQTSRPCHLLWDDDVPLPTPLTSLFWLLMCETWPLPSHKIADSTSVERYRNPVFAFPPQAFAIPASSSPEMANVNPAIVSAGGGVGFTAGMFKPTNLADVFRYHLSREDRNKIVKYGKDTVLARIYRPRDLHATSMRAIQRNEDMVGQAYWSRNEWSSAHFMIYDAGYCFRESEKTSHSLDGLRELRWKYFRSAGIITYPGMPSYEENLYHYTGSWIHNLSLYGMVMNATAESDSARLSWTSENERVTINGKSTTKVPLVTPPVWFGWSHFGPRYEVEFDTAKRIDTASVHWVEAYLKHRPQALEMLYNPSESLLVELIAQHTAARTGKLQRLGRIGKLGVEDGKDANTSIKNMIAESAKQFKLFQPLGGE